MADIISKVMAAIVAAVLIWAFKSYFFRRRLYLIQPRLFDYSDIANAKNSKTIELTVFNGGAKAEEKIIVQLSPIFTYIVVASNQSGLVVSKEGVFEIERLAPQEDVTIILTAEGGEFRKDHVIGVTSKETKGKIKGSLQDARVTPAQNAAAAFFLLFLWPLFGYGTGKFFESEIGPILLQKIADEEKIQFEVKNQKINLVSIDKNEAKKVGVSHSVVSVTRSADLVSVNLAFENKTDDRVTVSVYSSSPVTEGRDGHWADINPNINDVIFFPGVKKNLKIVEFLPAEVSPNMLTLHVVIETVKGRLDYYEDIDLSSNT